jgi:hypothetical protein
MADKPRIPQPPMITKEWPNKILKSPQPLPGQTSKKSPTDNK